MPASQMRSTSQVLLHGSGTPAFTIAATLATLGIVICVWNGSAWIILSLFFVAGIFVFSIIGMHRRSTTLRLDMNELVQTSWFDRRRITLTDLESLSLRTTMVGRSLAHSIVCWGQSGKELGEIDSTPYPRGGLRDLVQEIQQRHPQIRVDRELQRFLDTS